MSYAEATDIADRLGRDLDPSETRIVASRLEDVETLILTRISDLDERVASGKLNQRLIVMVESEVILRLIKNPDGYTQETDGNYSYSIDSRVASGRLSLLAEEWGMLGLRTSVGVLAPVIRIPTPRDSRVNPNADFEPDLDLGHWEDDRVVWG